MVRHPAAVHNGVIFPGDERQEGRVKGRRKNTAMIDNLLSTGDILGTLGKALATLGDTKTATLNDITGLDLSGETAILLVITVREKTGDNIQLGIVTLLTGSEIGGDLSDMLMLELHLGIVEIQSSLQIFLVEGIVLQIFVLLIDITELIHDHLCLRETEIGNSTEITAKGEPFIMLDSMLHLMVEDGRKVGEDLGETAGRSELAGDEGTGGLQLLKTGGIKTGIVTGFKMTLVIADLSGSDAENLLIGLLGDLTGTVMLIKADSTGVVVVSAVVDTCAESDLDGLQLRIGSEELGSVNDIGKDSIFGRRQGLDTDGTGLITPQTIDTFLPTGRQLDTGSVHTTAFKETRLIQKTGDKHKPITTGEVKLTGTLLTDEMGTGDTVGRRAGESLTEVKGIDMGDDIGKDLIGNLLLTGIADMQEIGNTAPETGDGLTETGKETLLLLTEMTDRVIGLQAERGHQTLVTPPATVMSQRFFGDLITGIQMGVSLTNLLPLWRRTHHLDDILPLGRVMLA